MDRLGGAHANTRFEAELDQMTRVLRSYGVLTDENLKRLSRAEHWKGPKFERVLQEGIRQDRIRRLDEHLYELPDGAWL
jgi:hypothetical protein